MSAPRQNVINRIVTDNELEIWVRGNLQSALRRDPETAPSVVVRALRASTLWSPKEACAELLRQMRDMAVDFDELIASTLLAVESEAQFDGFESADQQLSTWLGTFRQRPVYNNQKEKEICRRAVSAAFGEEWWTSFGWRGPPQGKTFLATLRRVRGRGCHRSQH